MPKRKVSSRIDQIIGIVTLALLCAVALIAYRSRWTQFILLLPLAGFLSIYLIDRARRKINSERVAAERLTLALKESDQLFRAAFDHAAGMGLATSRGEWLEVNKSLCQMLGYAEDELLAKSVRSISHAEDVDWMQEQINNLLEGAIASIQLEQRCLRSDGQIIWVILSVTKIPEPHDSAASLVFQIQDISDRKRAEEQLMHEALHDALTGLPNRALFIDQVRKSMARWRRRKQGAFAILFVDLDGFKAINDILGHAVGDQVLVEFSRRLGSSVRPGDTFARLGGDEFTILLDDLNDLNDAIIAVKRLMAILKEPFHLLGRDLAVSASIGVALSADEYVDADEMLRHADAAMYRAKQQGRGRYEMFDRVTGVNLERQSRIQSDLSHAIERAELVLEYQPIVALETGKIAGFEALLRWQHPTLGLVPPPDFISVAEATGAIVPIGEWVLHEGCRQIREWQKSCPQNPPLYISINLSVKQLAQPDLVEQVAVAVHKAGLDPVNLKLEITESMLMNSEAAIRMLSHLHALGVGISIDDFGTGYSSLSYLHRLPISTLKIDRSFVSSMSQGKESFEIVRTIITLAQSLNLSVVAEGIETNDQLEKLTELKCVYGQGHFFSKALAVEWAASYLFANRAPDGAPLTSPPLMPVISSTITQ
jgi:diguanylate cyclase (GGDEF)-like protein/PAS domain S-box-containing protein